MTTRRADTQAPPAKPWTGRPAGSLVEGEPIPPGWWASVVNDTEHLLSVLIGNTDPADVDEVPHRHRGKFDSFADPPVAQNLIRNASPSPFAAGNGRWFGEGWIDHEFDQVWEADDAGSILGNVVLKHRQHSPLFGNGCIMNGSLFARAVGDNLEAGALSFGVRTGQPWRKAKRYRSEEFAAANERFSDGFPAGGRGMVHFSRFTSSWQRFHVEVRIGSWKPEEEVQFVTLIEETFSDRIQVAAFQLTQGRTLYPWDPSPAESFDSSATGDLRNHEAWRNLPAAAGVPVFDWAVSMDDAVQVTAY